MADQNAPTVKPNKGVKFFNPGDRFNEPIMYTIPGVGDIHAIARWIVDAEAGSFFQVPTELKLLHDNTRLSIDFPTTVINRFKDRGVIMIDDEWEPSDDEDENDRQPFARTEDEAEEKGKRGWRRYLEKVVTNHIEQCNRAKSMGGMPLEAMGFTRRAFKLLNMVDPATHAFESLRREQTAAPEITSEREKQLQAQINELRDLILLQAKREEAKSDLAASERIEAQSSKAANNKRG